MNEGVGAAGCWMRKIDLLRQALDRPIAAGETVLAFHSLAERLTSLQAIPEPMGGTALHLAICVGAAVMPGHTLVVSDGQPDDPAQALAAAAQLSGTISTLYLGSDTDKEAIAFMRKLARLGCGQYQHCDVSNGSVLLLQQSIAGLLPS